MVRVLKTCVVNGVEYNPDPDVAYHESCFGPYLHELRVAEAIEFIETPGPSPEPEPERKTSFGVKRK